MSMTNVVCWHNCQEEITAVWGIDGFITQWQAAVVAALNANVATGSDAPLEHPTMAAGHHSVALA